MQRNNNHPAAARTDETRLLGKVQGSQPHHIMLWYAAQQKTTSSRWKRKKRNVLGTV
jgi:hypothetical protein